MNIKIVTLFFFLGLLAACSTDAPDVDTVKAQLALPTQWRHALPDGEYVIEHDPWWRSFHDPQLEALVERVLRSNNDLAAASFRVKSAEAQAGITRTNLTPNVSNGLTHSIGKSLDKGDPSTRAFTSTFSLSYEVDVWGRLSKARDVAEWEAMATREDRLATAMQLIGTTLQWYWQLAFVDQSLAVNDAGVANARSSLELSRVRNAVGQVSPFEPLQAAQQLNELLAAKTGLLQQREETGNALRVLLGSPSGEEVFVSRPIPGAAPAPLRPDIPARILAQRPDVKAAELRLRALFGRIELQQRSLYPILNLTAGVNGGGTRELSDILRNPQGVLTDSVFLPFLEFNKSRLLVQGAQADYQESVELFKKQLYVALQDVENALSADQQFADEAVYLTRALALSTQAEHIAQTRYRLGQSSIKEWLDLQDAQRTLEINVARNRVNRLLARVKFYQAIGGDCGDDCAGVAR
ncbi:efflux transporter outer membrane subunit [Pseudomonas fluorescens]|uniref:efflux transporter outer membrane subunit n=1 Tax=Pseudomonas fluorescens TaxID=294 RepID=UPI001486E829|nr:efflux transporter outer membrane subunit [Pseudomonas fluorescens]